MKTIKLKEAQARLGAWIDVAQSESLLVTRHGKPAALIIGVAGHELEDLQATIKKRGEDNDEVCRRCLSRWKDRIAGTG
ncbi:type II toxin-antitoxin system prevent-host-death family antitoxin [Candidatus Poribacteria bacterium]|nr:type II toxin-antitoxin system prevent-host-death family antitoxin [Candidatus Poribacteria bacterium]